MEMVQALSIEPVVQVASEASLVGRPDPRETLRRAFDTCADALYRFILIRCAGDRHAADDLLQKCCHVAAARKRLPETTQECERFLFGVAKNLLREHARRMRRWARQVAVEDPKIASQLAADMESNPLPSDVLERSEVRQQLLLAMTSLPAGEQQLLFDYYFGDRTQAELAASLGVTVKSVETKLYRARQHLRDRLRGLERN